MVRSVPHEVYVLAITSDPVAAHHIPPNTITHLPNLTKMMPDNSLFAVIVSDNAAWLALDKVMARISASYRERIRFACDVPTAYNLFRQYAARHDHKAPPCLKHSSCEQTQHRLSFVTNRGMRLNPA